jgi:hypothetical protein
MTISNRELVLGWLTLTVVLLGVTYWGAQSKYAEWQETKRERAGLLREVAKAQRMLDQKEEWETKLTEEQGNLPRHPEGKDVTAELLKTLERTAQDHGLILIRREPKPEKSLGDLFQVAIVCTWEGDLNALVHFLYAIHTKGAILDIRQLTVAPVQGQKGRLKGGFTVDCAYTRGAPTPAPEPTALQVEVAPSP